MAIHVPGKRDRRGRFSGGAKRQVVAVLSLTAMVDLFTVLAVFLLQNMSATGQVIHLSDQVILPNATTVKELKPANVVVISDEKINFNEDEVADFVSVKEQQDWMVPALRDRVAKAIAQGEEKKKSIKNQIREAIKKGKDEGEQEEEIDEFRKITIQADKGIDFLTVKKIMYTVTEAGIFEINFAVIKQPDSAESL